MTALMRKLKLMSFVWFCFLASCVPVGMGDQYISACEGDLLLSEVQVENYLDEVRFQMSTPQAQQSFISGFIVQDGLDNGFVVRELYPIAASAYVDHECLAAQAAKGDIFATYLLAIFEWPVRPGEPNPRGRAQFSSEQRLDLLSLSEGSLSQCPVLRNGLSLCNDLLQRGQLNCPCGLPEAQRTLANVLCAEGETEGGIYWYQRSVDGGLPRISSDACLLLDGGG